MSGHNQTRRVAVFYTGGTIGMAAGEGGYVPQSGHLSRRLAAMPQFHQPGEQPLTMPVSRYGRCVNYEVVELPPAQDSSDLVPSDWHRFALAIEREYSNYDAFVILHGTDTLAYTASALSFLLEGLQKTVILTGSQVPLSEVYNDAVGNLLGALTLAGHFDIPEVTIFFGDALLRGNRAQKVDASGFGAFGSANFPALATVGTSIDVAWERVWQPPADIALRVFGTPTEDVACLRLFPGIRAELLEKVLSPPIRGLVFETYGSGNIPSNRPDLVDVLLAACSRGVVVVNCTQCYRGAVLPLYPGATALGQAGVVQGGDLTPEAALTKLSVLLGRGWEPDQVKAAMTTSMRGEITISSPNTRFSYLDRKI